MTGEGAPEPVEGSSGNYDEQEIVNTLARLLNDKDQAVMAATRAGIPMAGLPDFRTPLLFWTKIVEEASKGANPGGVRALLDQAAQSYPYDRELARHLAPVRNTTIVDGSSHDELPLRGDPVSSRPRSSFENRRADAVQECNAALAELLMACSRAFDSPDDPEVLRAGWEELRRYSVAVRRTSIFFEQELIDLLNQANNGSWRVFNRLKLRQEDSDSGGTDYQEAYIALTTLYAGSVREIQKKFSALVRMA